VLLAVHVFSVTVGYGATILLGMLGACFVLQRARCGFPMSRLMALERVTLGFAVVSTSCTAVGVILGMFWANREWGRFWSWDGKEIGALCVVVWMVGALVAYSRGRVGARGLLVASLLGSNVVLLAWFAPAFLSGLSAYGSVNAIWAILPVVIILNLSLAVLELVPSGCTRART
jgi:ABC-type transport system involved in cytochrome c biogenesis permease subunit